MSNVLKSQWKSAVRQLIENQLAACTAVALVLAIGTHTPLRCACDAAQQRDPRGGVRAPVCLPLAVRTYVLFGAEGDRT